MLEMLCRPDAEIRGRWCSIGNCKSPGRGIKAARIRTGSQGCPCIQLSRYLCCQGCAIKYLSCCQSDFALGRYIGCRYLLDVDESICYMNRWKNVGYMHRVHEAPRFRHLYRVWELIIKFAMRSRDPFPAVHIYLMRHLLEGNIFYESDFAIRS
jgi:hypothetical protein